MIATPRSNNAPMKCRSPKKNGGLCDDWAMRGRTRCRRHGGKSLVGTAAPSYRTGKYSKYLPDRLREKYESSQTDPDLLSLRSEVALVDSRLTDLLSRVDTGESGQLWTNLKKAHEEFKLYRLAQDVPKMTLALARIETLLETGVQDIQAWREIGEQLDRRMKLAEAEHKRLVSLEQLITSEEALLIMRRVVDIITMHVSDKRALSQIIVDLQQMIGSTQRELPVYAQESDA